MKTVESTIISQELIQQKIYFLRGEKVIFDRDLAVLYGVETKVLNQAVTRNIKRFPIDFMFRLTKKETEIWQSQIVTLIRGKNIKYTPIVFTEQGVAMLSSVLKSERAIQVNVQIIRTFTQMRKIL
jgi:phage regulator Rha-like protein